MAKKEKTTSYIQMGDQKEELVSLEAEDKLTAARIEAQRLAAEAKKK